jgi:hypothetical protein
VDEHPLVPIDPGEVHWALNRPPHHRTPVPTVGERVCYRHHEWGEVTHAQVLAVQDPTDPASYRDHYLWHVLVDEARLPIHDGAGNRVLTPAPDPWPTLTLATGWGHRMTREARVRGSAGWLPLDWQTRYRPSGLSLAKTGVR